MADIIDLTDRLDEAIGYAIVTGADSGIGKAVAVQLAVAGFDVGITWHTDAEGAEETAREIQVHGRRAVLRQVDLTVLPDAADVIDDLALELGGLTVLVNNAGTGVSSPFVDQTFDEWRHTLTVNLDAPFLLAQRAARHMIANHTAGRIINVTSVHEHVPLPRSAAYCASKGGLGLLTKVMALELAEHGITVNAVAPGEVATPMTGQHGVDPSTVDRPAIPAGRPASAHEIANAIVYLAEPGADYITGTSVVIDGGMMLMAAAANQLVH